MKTDRLQDAIGKAQAEYIEDAEFVATRQPLGWVKWVAAAACLLVAVVIAISMQTPKADEADDSIVAQEPSVDEEPAVEPEEETLDEETIEALDGIWAHIQEIYPKWDPDAVHAFNPDRELSDDEIASLVYAMQTHLFYKDGKYTTGYRTTSTQLEVAGPIPYYNLDSDGTLMDNVYEYYIVFDDDTPVLKASYSYFTMGFDPSRSYTLSLLNEEGRFWEFRYTTSLRAVIESGATELAFVSGNDEMLLVYGDLLIETEFVSQTTGLHSIESADLSGLEFGSLDRRQTFEYQSPA